MKKNKTKSDLLLVLGILVIAGGLYLGNFVKNRKPAVTVEISIDGEVSQRLNLSEDRDLIIQGYNGGTNHLIIQDGTVRILEASCPDKVCVHQGKISQNSEIIVCLPNRMIAKIVEEP